MLIERSGSLDVAFAGGIDLCHGRRDDEQHAGDPQRERLDAAYGDRPGWHDVMVEVRGPVVADLAETFRERWNDPAPLEQSGSFLRVIRRRISRNPRDTPQLEPNDRTPAPSGTCAVQVLRTYPAKRPPFPFAPDGERSVARLYRKALASGHCILFGAS